MTPMRAASVIAALICLAWSSVAAAQTAPLPPATGQRNLEPRLKHPHDPFRGFLGGPRTAPAPAKPPAAVVPLAAPFAQAARPRVHCGMTLIPIDPRFDAAIRQMPPGEVRHTIQAMPAPPCER